MSVSHKPVQWGFNKYWYDAVVLGAVALYVILFIQVGTPDAVVTRPVDGAIVRMRAFGTCAFLMLTVILCIGPLARLDRRFLPLLYNRRHFGVITALVALTHAVYVLNWYFVFSPTPQVVALLTSNTSFDALAGFPFEVLGMGALLVLGILAATSHDFWLGFLGAPVWKRLHLLIYPAYAAVIAHAGLGYFQDARTPTFGIIFVACGVVVATLHLAARAARATHGSGAAADWIEVGRVGRIRDIIPDGRAVILRVAADRHVAVFRDGDALSAVSNACAHQNGPLGEGRVVDGCVTCPWHGFQYRLSDGCSLPPFSETVPTYSLRLADQRIMLNRTANPPGTPVPPLVLPAAGGGEARHG